MTQRLFDHLASYRTVSCIFAACAVAVSAADVVRVAEAQDMTLAGEDVLLSQTRQLTFDGKRSGEGYFSADGRQMVFQSERESDNPFYQIYLMDLDTGDVERVSPGYGKTTCAWIHPDGQHVIYASTQLDASILEKQKSEIDFRNSGQERRYSWDYDQNYDLIEWDRETGEYRQLTDAVGYDAEGCYSPDGEWVVFSSNRRAYEPGFSEREKTLFEIDPASALDLYIMRRDGSDPPRLTAEIGYDGGPFFSPDGTKICWRRFSENGATAEIYVMDRDGGNVHRLTELGAMSWAPFFHPTGEYLIFTTNLQGFGNFELYLVRADGMGEPVRVTYTDGFDGLPVFTPSGTELVWTSNRTSDSNSQLFRARWNHSKARELLGLPSEEESSIGGIVTQVDDLPSTDADSIAGSEAAKDSQNGFSAADIGRHIDYLCRPELGGRLTGTEGELRATAYVAAFLESLGLEPAGENGLWFAEFPFVAGVDLGSENQLAVDDATYALNRDWRPLVFSQVGAIEPSDVVFAGYGIVAPKTDEFEEYDSYVHLDVQDKWVLVFRQMPVEISPELRQHFARHSSLRYKATMARDRGARGIIFVNGPTSQIRSPLVPLELDGALSGSSVAAISISNQVASKWFSGIGKDLTELQRDLDQGEPSMGFPITGLSLKATIDVEQIEKTGRNVVGWLRAGDEPSDDVVLVGAHIDHLGQGGGGSSLARDDERNGTHRGADDNASGVAAMLEIAQYLADQKRKNKAALKRDVLFAAWSGEELGLIGSSYFADEFFERYPNLRPIELHHSTVHGADTNGMHHAIASEDEKSHHSASAMHDKNPHGGVLSDENPHSADPQGTDSHGANPHESSPHGSNPHGTEPSDTSDKTVENSRIAGGLYPAVVACINLDMVGRLRDSLVLQGVGSSDFWNGEIEKRNAVVGLPLTIQNDSYLPTDASTFYLKGVPILSAFTGSHAEYHTPRDVPELINYDGASEVARLLGLITRSIAISDEIPNYVQQEAPENEGRRASLTAYLGTIPDYAQADIKGVLLSGVSASGPAATAGVQGGDVITKLGGKTIENIYDYTFAIEALKIGQTIEIEIERDGELLTLKITPQSRQ